MDSRADIYSLGVVFYEMLTGELPGKRLEPPSRKVQIDVRLDEVVLRALEKNPDLRYQQVSEVKTMVETIVSSPRRAANPAETPRPSAGAAPPITPRFSRTAIAGACWILLSLTVISLLAYLRIKKHALGMGGTLRFSWRRWFYSRYCGVGLSVRRSSAGLPSRESAARLDVCGLGLAVFDGLLFPLLAVDGLLGWVACVILNAIGPAPHAGMFPMNAA